MKWCKTIAAISLVIGCMVTSGNATASDDIRKKINTTTVKVLGGSITGTYSRLVWEMADVLNDGYNFRVLPMLSQGSIKGVEDLIYLEGVDVALLQSDVLDFFVSKEVYPDLQDLLRYITVLYNEEVHLVAGPEIQEISDLKGKKVSFGPSLRGTFLTSSVIFSRLGIDVQIFDYSNQEGLERLKKGEIDAMMRVVGAPTRLFQDVDEDDNLHFVPIPLVDGAYFEASLTHEQYPELIPAGDSVKTVAVGAVMAAYNWPKDHHRRTRIHRLVERLQAHIGELQKDPHHEKWQQVRFERNLPGWLRWDENGDPRS